MLKKNKYKKEARLRRSKAREGLDQLNIRLEDPLYSVGIIFENLNICQLNYLAFQHINNLCRNFVGVDIAVFTQELRGKPFATLLCPILEIKKLITWKYPLITTTISSCLDALESYSEKIYYYMFDIDFLDNYNYNISLLHGIFHNPRVKVINRSLDHKNVIEAEFDIKTHDTIITDFDLNNIISIMELSDVTATT